MHSKKRLHLTSTERNLLNYVITQTRKDPKRSCLVPIHINTGKQDYLRAIYFLEKCGYLDIDRPTAHYPTWVAKIKTLPEYYSREQPFT